MKNKYSIIFAAVFIGVFALNINYQLKPVDNVWGISNAVATETNTSNTTGTIISELVEIISSAVSAINSYYHEKVWNCHELKCTATVYRKIKADPGVSWVPATALVGVNLALEYESKYVAGTKQKAIDGNTWAHKADCETDCVPNS